MSNILCVTNRKLCKEDFLVRIEKIAKENTNGIILREKDLSEEQYYDLATKVLTICNKHNTELILHNYPKVANKMGYKKIHLPLHVLEKLSEDERKQFDVLGASCHSLEDAITAEKLGCTYIFAGHIFETDCKKGLKGRGLDFLSEVCENVKIPVYAIGGMSRSNYHLVVSNGAKGCAVMSGLMVCDSPRNYIDAFEG